MDVCLVLTHRCNLDCAYCYAGAHDARVMDDATIARAVPWLYADGAASAELSFFGGEPFLAFDAMTRAVALARAQATALDRGLTLQCTTNGAALKPAHLEFIREQRMRVTVSIDGVREAHDLLRPNAGGGSSFAQVHRGLRGLLEAGCAPDVMMVIAPDTVPYVYRSVSFLWDEGIEVVRANLVLDAPWSPRDRDELADQLVAVASEMVARRMRGQRSLFEPFGPAMRGPSRRATGVVRPARQIVVATRGNLYPCAPMVGADRDDGREAALRLGHLDHGPAALATRLECDGAGCGDGQGCACAAYLETGDRRTAGPNGLWFAALCRKLGEGARRALDQARLTPAATRPRRRPVLIGLAAAIGGAAIGVPTIMAALSHGQRPSPIPRPAMPNGGLTTDEIYGSQPIYAVPPGAIRRPATPSAPPPSAPPPSAPPVVAPPPVQHPHDVEGGLSAEPMPVAPPPPPAVRSRGDLADPLAPPEPQQVKCRHEVGAGSPRLPRTHSR